MAGPGAGPVSGISAVLFQAGEVFPGRGRRAGSGERTRRARVTAFMVEYCKDRNAIVGEVDGDVAAIVPAVRARDGSASVPLWARFRCPRAAGLAAARLSAAELERLLAGARGDEGRPRDYAILPLLARLGLRGGEVAGLQLDDIDWRAGELTVMGKGSRLNGSLCRSGPGSDGRLADRWAAQCESRSVFVTLRSRTGRCRQRRSAPSWAGPATGPGWTAWVRTGCGTRWRPRCCAPARRCPRSGRCCGTAAAVHVGLCQGRPGRAAPAGAAVAGSRPVSALRARAEEYLAMRRALGFKLTT